MILRTAPAGPQAGDVAHRRQPDLLHAFIEPFLKGETPKGMFGRLRLAATPTPPLPVLSLGERTYVGDPFLPFSGIRVERPGWM